MHTHKEVPGFIIEWLICLIVGFPCRKKSFLVNMCTVSVVRQNLICRVLFLVTSSLPIMLPCFEAFWNSTPFFFFFAFVEIYLQALTDNMILIQSSWIDNLIRLWGVKLCIFSRVPFQLAAGLSLSLKMTAELKLNDSGLHHKFCLQHSFSHYLQDCYITLGGDLVHFGIWVKDVDGDLSAGPSILLYDLEHVTEPLVSELPWNSVHIEHLFNLISSFEWPIDHLPKTNVDYYTRNESFRKIRLFCMLT